MTTNKYDLIREEMANDAYNECIEVANRFAKAVNQYYSRYSNDMYSWSEFHSCDMSRGMRSMVADVRLHTHRPIELDLDSIHNSSAYDMGVELKSKWNDECERINKEMDKRLENVDPDYYDYLDDEEERMWKELLDKCAKIIDNFIDAAVCEPWECYEDYELDELMNELSA
jgi:hypothetical protein